MHCVDRSRNAQWDNDSYRGPHMGACTEATLAPHAATAAHRRPRFFAQSQHTFGPTPPSSKQKLPRGDGLVLPQPRLCPRPLVSEARQQRVSVPLPRQTSAVFLLFDRRKERTSLRLIIRSSPSLWFGRFMSFPPQAPRMPANHPFWDAMACGPA